MSSTQIVNLPVGQIKLSCVSFNSCLLELAISYTDIKMRIETVLSINWPSRCRTKSTTAAVTTITDPILQ